MRSVCFVALPDNKIVGAVGTEFFPCQSDATNAAGAASEIAGCSVLPADMTFRRLRAKVLASGFAAGESATITLRTSSDDGATWSDSALSVTVSDAVAQDNEDAVDVALQAGDLVTWKVVRSGGATGTDRTVWTCEIECAAGQPIFGHSAVARSASSDLPPNAWRQGSGTAYYFTLGAAATLKGLRGWCSTAPGGAAAWGLDVRGRADAAWSDTTFAALGFSASIGAASQTAVDAATTYALLRGNSIYFRMTAAGGTPAAAYLAMSAVLTPASDGLSTYSWRYSANDTVTRFMTAGLGGNQGSSTNEPRRQQLIPAADWTVRDAFLHTQNHASTPGAGNERGIDLRIDGAAATTTLLLGGADVLGEDLAHTDALAAGALISWQWTIGTSGLCDDLGSVRVGFVLEDGLAGSGPTDLSATGTGAMAGRASSSAKGAIAAATAGAITAAVSATARGAIVARSAGELTAAATPTSRVAAVATATAALTATAMFEPAGELGAAGSSTSAGAAALRGLGRLVAKATAIGTAAAAGTTTGSLSGAGLASLRGSANPGARVAATATNTASLASRVDVRAIGALRANAALALTSVASVTAGIPIVVHNLPGVGVLVATWQPSLSRTWRPHGDAAWSPELDPTRRPHLTATLHPHLEEAP